MKITENKLYYNIFYAINICLNLLFKTSKVLLRISVLYKVKQNTSLHKTY